MLALQASIGALNDLVDAPADAGLKARKPIPTGRVEPATARVVIALGLVAGLVLAAPSGPIAVALAGAGAATGYLYDLRLKGTALSWAPFAVGIPILPLFAWVGAGREVPAAFAILLPLGAVAGAALAIANALADHERDAAAGVETVATRLGRSLAWRVHAGLQVLVAAAAVGLVATSARGAGLVSLVATTGAAAVVLTGVLLAGAVDPAKRELGWEVEAAGIGILAVAWLASVAV